MGQWCVCVHAHVWVARQESGRSREEREWWRRNGWIVVRRVVGVAIVSLIVPPLLIKGAGLICSSCCYTIKAAIEDLKGFLQAFALGTCVCSGGFILYIPGCKHSVDVSVHVQVCVCILETTRLEGHMPSSHHAASPLMSDGKWSGHSVKRACRFNSPAHTSDPVNQTGLERNRIMGEEKKVWAGKKGRKREVTSCIERFKTKWSMYSLQTPPSLVHVCVFALMRRKRQRLPTSFVLYRAEFGFQKGLRTHTHTNYRGAHSPTHCSRSQLVSKCEDTLCVLTPLASEHLLTIRVAGRRVTLWRSRRERREWRNGGLYTDPLWWDILQKKTKSGFRFEQLSHT